MKCIKCDKENNLKERTENRGLCSQCKHPIVFDPKIHTDIPLTDIAVKKAIELISVNHTLQFTEKQLYYYLNNRIYQSERRKTQGCLIGIGIVFSILSVIILILGMSSWPFSFFGFLLFSSLAALIFAFSSHRLRKRLGLKLPNKTSQIPLDKFRELINRWQQVNGSIKGLLPPTPVTLPSLSPSREVAQYSFDRLIVTEHASIAQMLISNNFHFENNCAVLAIDRYPSNIFDTVMGMLRHNPNLKVFALHDCSPTGVALSYRIRTDPDWFGGQNVQVFDLGLLPRQILEKPVFIHNSPQSAQLARSLSPEIRRSLLLEELKWLEEGNFIELESLTPLQLLKAISIGLAKSRDPNSDVLVPIDDPYYPGGIYIYSYESFG